MKVGNLWLSPHTILVRMGLPDDLMAGFTGASYYDFDRMQHGFRFKGDKFVEHEEGTVIQDIKLTINSEGKIVYWE